MLGIDNIIVEGDSWCAIRWALGYFTYSKPPWSLANVEEEVSQLATKLNACFVHALWSANDTADALAKEGAGRPSLSIMMSP